MTAAIAVLALGTLGSTAQTVTENVKATTEKVVDATKEASQKTATAVKADVNKGVANVKKAENAVSGKSKQLESEATSALKKTENKVAQEGKAIKKNANAKKQKVSRELKLDSASCAKPKTMKGKTRCDSLCPQGNTKKLQGHLDNTTLKKRLDKMQSKSLQGHHKDSVKSALTKMPKADK